MIASTTLSLSVLLSSALAFTPCPIQGPDYPAPSGLADDPVFKDVISKLTQNLDNATEQSNALLTNLKANETSYSVVVFDAKSTLLSYHHTADALALAPESVSEVTGMRATSFFDRVKLTNPSKRTQSTASEVSASCYSSTPSLLRPGMTTGTGPLLILFRNSSRLPNPAQLKQIL